MIMSMLSLSSLLKTVLMASILLLEWRQNPPWSYNLLPLASVNSFPFPAPEPLIHSASATLNSLCFSGLHDLSCFRLRVEAHVADTKDQ